jgi:hypothetical protein
MIVVGERTVRVCAALAFRHREEEVLASLGGFDIEEIGALTGTHGFRKNIL